ncbi:MAG: NifB/NifX family molybdenum-iron cluster-binding protein [Bacteroidales bacterium]|nr:NifB/NifX family molybdenum-iron cluster-binding protein [Bacteroidales bacterium]
MRVAITAMGNSMQSKVDSKFGRCSYFVFYDTESESVEFLPNANKESVEGAGPASVQTVASRGVQKVVSGEFGAKVKSIFDQLQIQLIMVPDSNHTVEQIIEILNKNK